MQLVKVIIPTTPQRRGLLFKAITSCLDNAGMEHEIVIFENNGIGVVKAISMMLEGLQDSDIVAIGNDDIVFGKDWLKILYGALLSNPDKRLFEAREMNNPNRDTEIGTPLFTIGFWKEYWHNGYFHNFVDTEMNMRAKNKGVWMRVPDSITYHNHWSFGKSDRDSTYLAQMEHWELDKDLFNERYALSDGFRNMDKL